MQYHTPSPSGVINKATIRRSKKQLHTNTDNGFVHAELSTWIPSSTYRSNRVRTASSYQMLNSHKTRNNASINNTCHDWGAIRSRNAAYWNMTGTCYSDRNSKVGLFWMAEVWLVEVSKLRDGFIGVKFLIRYLAPLDFNKCFPPWFDSKVVKCFEVAYRDSPHQTLQFLIDFPDGGFIWQWSYFVLPLTRVGGSLGIGMRWSFSVSSMSFYINLAIDESNDWFYPCTMKVGWIVWLFLPAKHYQAVLSKLTLPRRRPKFSRRRSKLSRRQLKCSRRRSRFSQRRSKLSHRWP